MDFNEARRRLNQWTQFLDGKDASTHKVKKPGPHQEGLAISWWSENSGSTPDWRGTRTIAYLCAYLDMTRGPIPLEGIRLDDGFIWPDRAVIRTLLANDCLDYTSDLFALTSKGEALVAPFVLLEHDDVRINRAFE